MLDHLPLASIVLVVVYGFVLYQLLQWWRYQPRSAVPVPSGPKANAPRRPRLPGLIERPHCEACAEEALQPTPHGPAQPPPLTYRDQGRPRHIDTSGHYCPNQHCRYYGWLARGNIRANGHPSARRWRQLHCTVCGHYFNETHGTLFHGKTHAPEVILRVIAALAEGLGIRAVGRVFEVDANTVLAWLTEAADHAEAVSAFLLTNLRVEQVQLDELFALIGELRAGRLNEHDALERLARRPRWVWTALDPVSKLLIAVSVGDRSLAMAQRLVHQVLKRLAPGTWPLFLSDGFHDYATALLTHLGRWVRFPRRQPNGAAPKPRWCAHPQLQYAQVVKQYRRRRLVSLVRRVVFGCQERIAQVLARHGWQINTAFVERLNLTLRQHVAAIGRRVITLAKSEAGLQRQLYLFQGYFNFCLPHSSLGHDRKAITPAMAAGITDHVWRLRQLLLFRVPPWPQRAQH